MSIAVILYQLEQSFFNARLGFRNRLSSGTFFTDTTRVLRQTFTISLRILGMDLFQSSGNRIPVRTGQLTDFRDASTAERFSFIGKILPPLLFVEERHDTSYSFFKDLFITHTSIIRNE